MIACSFPAKKEAGRPPEKARIPCEGGLLGMKSSPGEGRIPQQSVPPNGVLSLPPEKDPVFRDESLKSGGRNLGQMWEPSPSKKPAFPGAGGEVA